MEKTVFLKDLNAEQMKQAIKLFEEYGANMDNCKNPDGTINDEIVQSLVAKTKDSE
jgi:hypothetical protein